VPQLAVASKGTDGDGNCTAFRVGTKLSNRTTVLAQVNVATDIDGGYLTPGTAYYVRVAARNAVGLGLAREAVPDTEFKIGNSVAPQAPPGLPTNVRVYANRDDGSSLLVKWNKVDTNNGAPITRYSIEYLDTETFGQMSYAERTLMQVFDWSSAGGVYGVQNFTSRDIDAQANHEYYAANLTNLTCGVPVVVRVRAWNRQGAGGPVWYSQIDMHDAQLALPLCSDGIEDCVEPRAFNWSITPRALVDEPPFQIPLSGAIPSGDGSDLELKNSFTKSSLMVTFGLPNITYCPTANVTKWKVEWDTLPTFNSKGTKPLSYNEVLGTSPEIEDKGDGEHEVGSGYYNITGLEMGRRYYIRVSAFNSLGYGDVSDYIDAIPCVSADAPGLPTTLGRRPDANTDKSQASSLTDEAVEAAGYGVAGSNGLGGISSMERATSLDVQWQTPTLSSEYEDPNGAGGDPVDGYVVEWSHRPFESYNKSVQTIAVTCSGGGRLSGEIRLMHNTTGLNVADSLSSPKLIRTGLVEDSVHVSSDIEMNSTAWDMRTILMNMPNG
jgi:hypothetical protein